jgi:8-oxo-dGTP pyrophosphatase MutT (NUDIX family)
MTMRLEELVRRLNRALAETLPMDAAEDRVVFGPGERQLAEAQLAQAQLAQTMAEKERTRIARQGIVARGAGTDLRRAAVLIPLVARHDGITVLLTRRTAHLAAHAGQISFPGGRLEPQDRDARDAALRETEEEIGLPRACIRLLGELEEYGTITGFRVTPVIGIATPPFTLTPDPTEVAEIFEVPLAFVLDPANRRHAVEKRDGIERDIYEILFGDYRIWGFTARLLVRLVEAIESAAETANQDRAAPRAAPVRKT